MTVLLSVSSIPIGKLQSSASTSFLFSRVWAGTLSPLGIALLTNVASLSQPFLLLQKTNAPQPAFAVSTARLTTRFVTGFWSSLDLGMLIDPLGVNRDLNLSMSSLAGRLPVWLPLDCSIMSRKSRDVDAGYIELSNAQNSSIGIGLYLDT